MIPELEGDGDEKFNQVLVIKMKGFNRLWWDHKFETVVDGEWQGTFHGAEVLALCPEGHKYELDSAFHNQCAVFLFVTEEHKDKLTLLKLAYGGA